MKDIKRYITGIFYIITGFLIAAGPVFIFPVCEDMGDKRMKCFWTMRAEIGVGAVIGLLGVIILFTASKEIRIGIESALTLLFVYAALIPDVLIGVCGGNHMRCKTLTLPALNIIGAVGIVYSVVSVFLLVKSVKGTRKG